MFSKLLSAAAASSALVAAAYADPPAQACQATSFRVYFEPGASTLGAEARALIGMAARDVDGCEGITVTLVQASRDNAAEQRRAVVSSLLAHGVHGAISAAPLHYPADAAGAPDFVEVRLAPMRREEHHAENLDRS